MLLEFPIFFSKFVQLCYKIRFAFNFCNIKIVENSGPDEIHSIGEAYKVSYDYISKSWEGIYLDLHLIYFAIVFSI